MRYVHSHLYFFCTLLANKHFGNRFRKLWPFPRFVYFLFHYLCANLNTQEICHNAIDSAAWRPSHWKIKMNLLALANRVRYYDPMHCPNLTISFDPDGGLWFSVSISNNNRIRIRDGSEGCLGAMLPRHFYVFFSSKLNKQITYYVLLGTHCNNFFFNCYKLILITKARIICIAIFIFCFFNVQLQIWLVSLYPRIFNSY